MHAEKNPGEKTFVRRPAPPVSVSAVQLLRAARGFSCLFWGLPLSLLLVSERIIVKPVSGLRLPAYVLGVLIAYCGMLYLYRAGPFARGWRGLVRQGLFIVFLQMYFAPFYYWWSQRPHVALYLGNVLALAGSVIWALYILNQLAATVGRALNDDTFYIEARLCGWAVLALMGFPLVSVAGYCLQSSLRFDSNLYMELVQVHGRLPPWIYALFLLPFTLTMATTWKAKECCLQKIPKLVPPPPEPPEMLDTRSSD